MPETSENYVLDKAREKGIPIVLITPHELLGIAQGHPTIVADIEGNEMCVKVPTVEEYFAALDRARPELERMGVPLPPYPTTAQVRRVVEPLGRVG